MVLWQMVFYTLATVTRYSVPTSSTTAVTSRWGAPGTTSTSLHSDARSCGRTPPEGYPQTKPYELWNWHDEYGDTTPSRQWVEKVQGGIAAGQGSARKAADAT